MQNPFPGASQEPTQWYVPYPQASNHRPGTKIAGQKPCSTLSGDPDELSGPHLQDFAA
jgi:hypothetical protein